MPIYEYSCQNCGKEFELLIRGDEKPACPACGDTQLVRAFSAPAAHTSGPSSAEACPAKNTCGMSHCCGNNCGMGDWM